MRPDARQPDRRGVDGLGGPDPTRCLGRSVAREADDATVRENTRGRTSRFGAGPLGPGDALRLGRYVLGSVLGSGGMGTVYRARDERLGRDVAIKILFGHGDCSDRSSLYREAKTLARLSHPNVVEVFEVGSLDARVFLVMELVEGDSLGDWQNRRARTLEEILDVYAQAARGLAAAHANGLVHRDFKPANVLVGKDGRVRVVDFGIAYGLSDTEAVRDPADASEGDVLAGPELLGAELDTATCGIVGTPAYMAPEQRVAGPATPASDQYSFCVALHEAVYGRRPGTDETPPSRRGVPHWLARLIQTGLQLDPAARWPDMSAIIHRLEARRTRASVAGRVIVIAGGSALALGALEFSDDQGGPCADSRQAMQSAWNEGVWKGLAGLEGTGPGTSAPQWSRVRRELDAYAEQWFEVAQSVCGSSQKNSVRNELESACLRDRIHRIEAVLARLETGDPSATEHALTSVLELPSPRACMDRSGTSTGVTLPDDPKRRARRERWSLELSEAEALLNTGERAKALALARRLRTRLAARGAELSLRIRAELLFHRTYEGLEDAESARQALERYYFEAQAAGLDREALQLSLALAHPKWRTSGGARAAWAESAKALAERMRDERARALAMARLADAQQDPEKGVEMAKAALEAMQRAPGAHELDFATSHDVLGHAYERAGAFEASTEHRRASLQILLRLLGPGHESVAAAYVGLGWSLLQRGNEREASDALFKGLQMASRRLDPVNVHAANAYEFLGSIAYHQRRYDDAEVLTKLALSSYRHLLDPPQTMIASALNTLGLIELDQGHYEQALDHLAQALAIREAEHGVESRYVAITLANIAVLEGKRGRLAQAREAFERSLEILETIFGPTHPDTVPLLSQLALVELKAERLDAAVEHATRAVETAQKRQAGAGRAQDAMFLLARLLWERGTGSDRERAVALAYRARAQYAELGASRASDVRQVARWLERHGPSVR